jgi:hypothetical protein
VGFAKGGGWAYMAGLTLGLVSVLAAYAGSRTEPPAVMLLKIPALGSRPTPPVRFNHQSHEARAACTLCHHEFQGRRNVWHEGQPVQKCQACHSLKPVPPSLDLKNAMHRQCKGCHLRLRQQARPAGPIECRGCHRGG